MKVQQGQHMLSSNDKMTVIESRQRDIITLEA